MDIDVIAKHFIGSTITKVVNQTKVNSDALIFDLEKREQGSLIIITARVTSFKGNTELYADIMEINAYHDGRDR